MKRMREVVGRELVWTQPKAMSREFELKDGEEVVATLRFRSPFGSFATAETGDGTWTFKRVGFWQTYVTICPVGSGQAIAMFRNNTWHSGGTLELPNGRTFKASTNFWMTKFDFYDESEASLVQFEKIGGVLHASAQVGIAASAASLPELPWLVALGWYLAVMMRDDGGAAAVIATS